MDDKKDYTVAELDGMLASLQTKRQEVEAKKKIYSAANEELDAMEADFLGVLRTLNKTSYHGEHGVVTRVTQYRVNLPATPEDWDAFYTYLKRNNDFERMITVNSQKLNTYFKEVWELVKQADPIEGLNFSMPGIGEPKAREILQLRSKS